MPSHSSPDARDNLPAVSALPSLQMLLPDHESNTLDDGLPAIGTVSIPGLMAGYFRDIDVVKAAVQGHLTGLLKRGNRGGGQALELVKGIEAREVNGGVFPEFPADPLTHFSNQGKVVVPCGDH